MIRWIISSSMQFRFLMIALAVVLTIYGVYELRDTSVSVYPEFDPVLVEVQTEAIGLSAPEVESLITVMLEADLLNGVAWLDKIYSESVAGLSSVLLVFEPGTDPIEARQMVQERLTRTGALPKVSTPPTMLQPLSTTNRVMIIGLSSQDLSLIEMSVLARWNIKPRLMGVPGVANVAIWGEREWQLQVQVDPEQLHEQGVTLQQVIKTTGEALWVSPLSYLEASSPGTSGWIDSPNQRLGIRHLLPITSSEGLARVPVVGSDELLLGDISTVVEDHQPLIGDAFLGEGQSILLVIEKFPGASVLEVTEGVDAALEDMRPGLSGIEIDKTVFRPATYIENSIDNLSIALLAAAALVILALGIFFFEWRTVVICLVTIPVSLIAAAFVLHSREVPFNAMILAGWAAALSVVVGDGIMDVENIARRLRERRQLGSDQSTASIVLEALIEIRGPLMFSVLIILLAALPIFLLGGLAGRFLEPFGLAYVMAVLISLAVALILTPALSLLLMTSAPVNRRESPLTKALQYSYHALLVRVVRAPYALLILAGVVIVVGLVAALSLDRSFVPSFKQTDLLVQVEAAPGTSHIEMGRIMTLVSQEVQRLPGVRNVGFHIGRAITGDQVVDVNSGAIWVSLDPEADYDTAVAAVRNTIDEYPGLVREVQTYEPERIDDALIGDDEHIVVRVYGHEFDVLRTQAEAVSASLAGIDGVDEARVEYMTEGPQVEIEVDLNAAARHGLKPGEIRRAATTLLSGLQVGSLYQEQKVFSVVVWSKPEIRHSLTDIQNLLIDTPNGDQVRLGEVADVRIVPSPTIIQRESVSRYLDVEVSVSGRSLAAVADDIENRLESIEFPVEYHAVVQGEFADRRLTQQRMIGAAIVAVLGIFLLLQSAYGSWRLAAVAISTLPMALAGGVFAALLAGGDLSLGTLFGLLAVLGIAVRNGLLLTTHYQHLEQPEGDEKMRLDLVLRGARERLPAIVTTAVAIGLANLPFVLIGDKAGFEILRPMAIVILGGLVTSTLLALFILPTVYLRFGHGVETETLHLALDEVQHQQAPS